MSDVLVLEFESPRGNPLRFEWDEGRIAAPDPDPSAEALWRLAGELDWDEVQRVRVLSAQLADGRAVALAALMPAGAEGHGDEVVAAALGSPGEFAGLERALLSTEYGPDGLPRRVGLELYGAEDPLATRIAADVSSTARSASGAVERVGAALAVRGDGGTGSLDLLTKA